MELVNNEYVRLEKIDIFSEAAKSMKMNDNYLSQYFQGVIEATLKYEKENNIFVNEIYIPTHDISDSLIEKLPIKRQTLINAYFFANSEHNNEIASKLLLDILEKESEYCIFKFTRGSDITDYVLKHSIDVNEYYDGEKARLVYNAQENSLENAYIYGFDRFNKKKIIKR